MGTILSCLQGKIDDGTINKSMGKRLLKRAEALNGHFQDEGKAAEIAIKSFENEMAALGKQQNRAISIAQDIHVAAAEVSTDKEARLMLNNLTQMNHQFTRNGHRTLFGSSTAAGLAKDFKRRQFVGLNKVDNEAIISAITSNTKGPPRLAATIAGIKGSFRNINRTLVDAGAPGAAKHSDNFMPLDLQPGSLNAETVENFAESLLKNADIDHLIENTPFFHRFQGGTKEYLELAYKVFTEGAATQQSALSKLKVGPAEFKDIFTRSLKAKSLEGWQEFDSSFGNKTGDVLASLMSYSDRMAEYTARLEVYGNNPTKYLDTIKFALGKFDIADDVNKAASDLKYIHFGRESHIFPNRIKLGRIGKYSLEINPQKIAATLTAMNPWLLLRGAVVMATLGDGQFSKNISKEIGGKSTTRIATLMRTKGTKSFLEMFESNREIAARTAASIDFYTDALQDTVRSLETGVGAKFMDSSSSWLLRVAGLTHITNINRTTNVTNTMFNLAEMKGLKWEKLEPRLKFMFARFGIGEESWDIMRKKAVTSETGGLMMNPGALIESDLPLARKFASFMALVQEKGTPTSSAKLSQWIDTQKKAGLITGIWAQSIGTFQGFNASVWANHTIQAAAGKGRGSLYASLIAYTSIMGTIGLTLLNAHKNQTTNFSDPQTYLDGALKGGALGALGDVATTVLGIGGGYGGLYRAIGKTSAGVAGGTIVDTTEAITRNAKKLIQGKETKLGYDMLRIARKYNFLEKNLYFGEFTKKYFDQIQEWTSPKTFKRSQTGKRRRQKKEGTGPLLEN